MGTERLIKNEVVRFSAELGIIATFLTIGIETASHFSEVLHSSKFIVAVLASMYVVTLRVCWQIKNPQKDAYGKPRYDHSESKKAWAGRIMIISSVLIPLSIAGILYFNQKTLSNNIAIITTRFEKDKDPFHTKLNELIKKYDEKNHLDSVDLKFQNKYYDDYVNFNTDSMLNIFNCNNAKRGLLVIGSKNYDHDDEDFFYCYIYINQLANLNMNKNLKDIDTSFHSDNIIHLLEQRFISFSTFTQQAEELAKFIMGLLYFNAGDLEKASETFTDIKNNAASAPSSSKLSATCSEWLGHISVRKNDVPKALGHYLESAEKDSANLPLLNNIGGLYYHQKDTVNAYKYFLKAKALDDNYTIPINQPTSSGPVSAAPKDNTDDASKLAEQKQLADEKKKAEAKKKEDQRIADEKKKEDERIAEVKKQADLQKKNDGLITEQKKLAALRKKREQDSINAIAATLDIPVIFKDQVKYRLMLDFDKSNPYFITYDNDFIKIINAKNNYKLVGKFEKNGITTSLIKDLNEKVVFEIVGKELFMNTKKVGYLQDYK